MLTSTRKWELANTVMISPLPERVVWPMIIGKSWGSGFSNSSHLTKASSNAGFIIQSCDVNAVLEEIRISGFRNLAFN